MRASAPMPATTPSISAFDDRAQIRDLVDERNLRRQERVGRIFDHLRGVHVDDVHGRSERRINSRSIAMACGSPDPDYDSDPDEENRPPRFLRAETRVGGDRKVDRGIAVRVHDALDQIGCFHGNRGFVHHDDRAGRVCGNFARGLPYVREIRFTRWTGRRTDRDERERAFLYASSGWAVNCSRPAAFARPSVR